MTKTNHRIFDTWASRDTSDGKLEYSNYIHPLNDFNFAQYMQSKQIIWWEYRRWDNRQKWIPEESLFDSLIRHIEIVKLLRKWYDVYEKRNENWSVELIVKKKSEKSLDFEQKDIISELNAIRFNSEAMKLFYLTNNEDA